MPICPGASCRINSSCMPKVVCSSSQAWHTSCANLQHPNQILLNEQQAIANHVPQHKTQVRHGVGGFEI